MREKTHVYTEPGEKRPLKVRQCLRLVQQDFITKDKTAHFNQGLLGGTKTFENSGTNFYWFFYILSITTKH